MRKSITTALLFVAVLCSATVLPGAQERAKTQLAGYESSESGASAEPTAEDPAHEELRELRDAMLAAVRGNDLPGVLSHMHPNAVVVWMDGEVSRGHAQIEAYYNRMMCGDKRIVESFSLDDFQVDELTILYGEDTGVAYGTAESHFALTSGEDFVIQGAWSATLVKEDGKWLLASFHSSAGLFDNPLLKMATRWLFWGCGLAASAACSSAFSSA